MIPELEATSNKVSGVVSPSPNLPVDVEEKMANLVPVLSKISMSAVKDAPFLNSHTPVTVSSCDNDAGPPAPQSKAMVVSRVPDAVRAK